jgi:hypothetical protein
LLWFLRLLSRRNVSRPRDAKRRASGYERSHRPSIVAAQRVRLNNSFRGSGDLETSRTPQLVILCTLCSIASIATALQARYDLDKVQRLCIEVGCRREIYQPIHKPREPRKMVARHSGDETAMRQLFEAFTRNPIVRFDDKCSGCDCCALRAGDPVARWSVLLQRGTKSFTFQLCGSSGEPTKDLIDGHLAFLWTLPLDADALHGDESLSDASGPPRRSPFLRWRAKCASLSARVRLSQ